MRVLVIDEELPWPSNTGKRIRTYELLRRLAASFDITFAYHEEAPPSDEARAAFVDAGITLHPVPRRPLEKKGARFAWDLLRNVFLSVPYMVMAHRTRAMQDAVREVVARGEADLVHAEWTPLVANVVPDLGVPVCIAAHNVESQIWERYREHESRFLRRQYIALQAKKVERFERSALRAADAVVAVSEEDGARIRSWAGQGNVTVVPNGVDADGFAPRPDVEVRPASTLFVGSLDWRPNLDGVTWYLDEVWPRLRKRCADATFTIVGRNPPAWLPKRVEALEGVTLAGGVPDVRPYVAGHAVSVVPLRIGGGSRLKICEALAMQRPIVSTTVGAEGLDLGDGLVRADDAEAFAEAVGSLFDNASAAEAMAARGRARVMERYTWDGIAPIQAEVWRRTLATREPRA